jgi:hypothetical protein
LSHLPAQQNDILIKSFHAKLNEFIDAAKNDGVSVSAKPNKNYRYIGQLLEKYEITALFPNKNATTTNLRTFKDLLVECKSLQGTCSFLQERINSMKASSSSVNEGASVTLEGLMTLRDCFQLVRTALNKNLASEEPLFICALCWKRVRVSDEPQFEGRKDSTFYCPDHLPNKSEHLYRRDRTALISAMKATNNRFLDEFKYYEKLSFKASFSLIPTFYKWLGSFSPKASALFSSIQRSDVHNSAWQVKANLLTELSSTVYPISHEKIKEVDACKYESIESWLIDGVITALDNDKGKNEAKFWKQEEDTRAKLTTFLIASDTRNRDVFENENTNEYLMLMCSVLSRYEAYQIVKKTPQPRGGGNEKNEILRSKIRSMRDLNIKTSGKQNVKSIATRVGISQARVYKILTELKSLDGT